MNHDRYTNYRASIVAAYNSIVDKVKESKAFISFYNENTLYFSTEFKSSIINFYYKGRVEIGYIDTAKTIPCIYYDFEQEDTGRFDTAQKLSGIVLMPEKISGIKRQLNEYELSARFKSYKRKISDNRIFLRSILGDIESYTYRG